MKTYEYQAQSLLREFGIPTPVGKVAATAAEAGEIARQVGCPVVVKAQVHVGGRGKAGGVRLAESPEAAEAAADAILKLTIKGLPVRKVFICAAAKIAREAYLSILLDRALPALVFIGCAEGGVEIEETARKTPEKIQRLQLPVEPCDARPTEFYLPLADKLFPGSNTGPAVAKIMASMEKLFRARDCSLVEINPLVLTAGGSVMALDAKILLDDNALERQAANAALRDPEAEDPAEIEAQAAGLTFIGLDGNIGCMVNGAGLAMATMDTIKHLGGSPANFLDVGGSSSPEKIQAAFRIILRNPQVKVIFINIFGGITRCDDVARGIVAAQRESRIAVPLVVRLVGTNEEAGRNLLADMHVTVASTLEEGARRAAEMARGSNA